MIPQFLLLLPLMALLAQPPIKRSILTIFVVVNLINTKLPPLLEGPLPLALLLLSSFLLSSSSLLASFSGMVLATNSLFYNFNLEN